MHHHHQHQYQQSYYESSSVLICLKNHSVTTVTALLSHVLLSNASALVIFFWLVLLNNVSYMLESKVTCCTICPLSFILFAIFVSSNHFCDLFYILFFRFVFLFYFSISLDIYTSLNLFMVFFHFYNLPRFFIFDIIHSLYTLFFKYISKVISSYFSFN